MSKLIFGNSVIESVDLQGLDGMESLLSRTDMLLNKKSSFD